MLGPPILPSESCPAQCCRRGPGWAKYYLAVDRYMDGPCQTGLNKAWTCLQTGVFGIVHFLRKAGLARWDKVPPAARDRMSEWSPVARQLWESDFEEHQDGLLQAWVWHYLEDNIFWSAGATGAVEELAPCASPLWEYVRGLRRELHGMRSRVAFLLIDRADPGVFAVSAVRVRHSNTPKTALMDPLRSQNRLAHLQTWGRLTESLAMHGLGHHGQKLEPFSPEQLIPHFKKSIRQLVVDGDATIPDREDNTWVRFEIWATLEGDFHKMIQQMLFSANNVRHFFHGMAAVWDLRFSPPDVDKPWGFAYDDECMWGRDPAGVPWSRPGEEARPPVQLVIQPMLVKSGFDGARMIQGFHTWACMQTLSPWTFDINDADPDHPRHLGRKECSSVGEDNDAGNDDVAGGGGRAQGEAKDPEKAAKTSRGTEEANEQTVATASVQTGNKRKGRGAQRGAKHIRAK